MENFTQCSHSAVLETFWWFFEHFFCTCEWTLFIDWGNDMKRLWGFLALVLLTACGSDDKLSSFSSYEESALLIDQFGERSNTCPVDSEDQVTVETKGIEDSLFTGKVVATLSVNSSNCYRIGSTVEPISQLKKDVPLEERIYFVVLKVEIVSIEQIQAEHAEVMGIELNELKALAWAKLEQAKLVGMTNESARVSFTFFTAL